MPFQTGATVGVELAAYTLLLDADGNTVDALRRGSFDLSADGTFSYTSAVPVPAALWLFGSALLGLATRRRRS